ncbi:hypothetical protein CO038_03960 [Candidatus Pacearchaeota archaeon CG_4_9_14_0_2_um_filter_39_13]|nr:DUF106 domain-containing protein [Candidatus Pacearchaeota archaeon]OIO43540.1 MAG: hypothetical protein AUJ64_02215 [Candidatus Pacearchaeota archaeon CG1_02_39_14]PJC44340.1 MAG: hypothetical protein CO038_03960 [Candidatus Pacearchaeota archaeon CG_4_9_14_0_2_um_filter_39_13]
MIEFIQANPRVSIIGIAVLISFFISLVNFFVLDKEKIRDSKKRQKELQQSMKEYKDDPAKIMELNKEMMAHVGDSFKHSLKPMIITVVPILIVFGWIKGVFAETTIAGSWFWWYLGSAIASSLIFRKLFKLP